ncbi:efflux RND transporter periplasmic adaptor subunit [Tumidithrix elongata RA019]|uniref:Efflux RND transporter periplasmic adaptor subunit n=1 Tax=Tumidithrix elongata BACA0141 TaxID=2716417 RepID=A0AAW9PTJ7_9CYAN|nr:efflux RND transporter periplasmic adaptor subunit [Tumidithrix elongata RA019]
MSEHQLEIPLNYEEVLNHSSHGNIPNQTLAQDSSQELTENGSKLRPKVSKTRRIGLTLAGLLLLGIVGFFSFRALTATKSDDSGKKGDRQGQVIPVAVATVTQKTVPIQLQAIGNVQAGSTVSVTPQAGGQITGVYFKKGQEVHKGDLLFTIDNRSQTASIQQAQGVLARDQASVQQARATLAKDLGLVRQAEATLAKDEAQAQLAQAQSNRYNDLYKQGAISQDQAQQYATSNRVSEAVLQGDREAITNALAVVEGDKAAIANAEALLATDEGAYQNVQVQASYTQIYAPIDGRVGNILVTEGNVVQANSSNPLVTIAQINPIQVSFAIPEANLPEIQKRMQNGKLNVDVTFAGNTRPISGTLTFINNTVDNTTGTIQLIGDFNNAEGKLFPGQFVNTTLTLTQEPNAIVVPAQAVQNGANGQFVFVVNPDDSTVTNVPVVATATIDGLDVIQKGLKPGDQVVTDGQANLVTGSKVRVKAAPDNTAGDRSTGDNGVTKPATDPTKTGKPRKPRSGNSNTSQSGNNQSGTSQSGKPVGGQ